MSNEANEANSGDPGVHLQGVGLHNSKLVSDVVVGDVLVWNFGFRSEVLAIVEISACFRLFTLRQLEGRELNPGSSSDCKLKRTRRVAFSAGATRAIAESRAEKDSA